MTFHAHLWWKWGWFTIQFLTFTVTTMALLLFVYGFPTFSMALLLLSPPLSPFYQNHRRDSPETALGFLATQEPVAKPQTSSLEEAAQTTAVHLPGGRWVGTNQRWLRGWNIDAEYWGGILD